MVIMPNFGRFKRAHNPQKKARPDGLAYVDCLISYITCSLMNSGRLEYLSTLSEIHIDVEVLF